MFITFAAIKISQLFRRLLDRKFEGRSQRKSLYVSIASLRSSNEIEESN